MCKNSLCKCIYRQVNINMSVYMCLYAHTCILITGSRVSTFSHATPVSYP